MGNNVTYVQVNNHMNIHFDRAMFALNVRRSLFLDEPLNYIN